MEYEKLEFKCLINLAKRDRHGETDDVVDILKEKQVPKTIIEIIKQLNITTSTHITKTKSLAVANKNSVIEQVMPGVQIAFNQNKLFETRS